MKTRNKKKVTIIVKSIYLGKQSIRDTFENVFFDVLKKIIK